MPSLHHTVKCSVYTGPNSDAAGEGGPASTGASLVPGLCSVFPYFNPHSDPACVWGATARPILQMRKLTCRAGILSHRPVLSLIP